jgi:hypothetical protein
MKKKVVLKGKNNDDLEIYMEKGALKALTFYNGEGLNPDPDYIACPEFSKDDLIKFHSDLGEFISRVKTVDVKTIPQVGEITIYNCISLLGKFMANEDVYNVNYYLYASENTVRIYRQLIKEKRICEKIRSEKFRILTKYKNNILALYDVRNEKMICITE